MSHLVFGRTRQGDWHGFEVRSLLDANQLRGRLFERVVVLRNYSQSDAVWKYLAEVLPPTLPDDGVNRLEVYRRAPL